MHFVDNILLNTIEVLNELFDILIAADIVLA